MCLASEAARQWEVLRELPEPVHVAAIAVAATLAIAVGGAWRRARRRRDV